MRQSAGKSVKRKWYQASSAYQNEAWDGKQKHTDSWESYGQSPNHFSFHVEKYNREVDTVDSMEL